MRARATTKQSPVALAVAACMGILLSAFAVAPVSATSLHVSQSAEVCVQPPANLNTATVTNTQLALYGLPLRPTTSSGIAHWESVVTGFKHRVCATRPATSGFHHILENASHVQTAYSSVEKSGNWTGVVAYGYGYQRVEGSWQISQTNLDNLQYDSASWVGIGGDPYDGGGVLAQAGSESTSQGGHDYYYLWYQEIDPARGTNQMPPQIISTAVSYFDSVETIVDDNYSFPGQTYIFVGDISAGVYFGQAFTYGQSVGGFAWEQTNHSTAEWVTEKTQAYLDLSHVPNCPSNNQHCITFTQDHATRNGTDTYIDALPTNAVTMWRGSTQLAYPGPIHNSGGSAFFNNYLVHS